MFHPPTLRTSSRSNWYQRYQSSAQFTALTATLVSSSPCRRSFEPPAGRLRPVCRWIGWLACKLNAPPNKVASKCNCEASNDAHGSIGRFVSLSALCGCDRKNFPSFVCERRSTWKERGRRQSHWTRHRVDYVQSSRGNCFRKEDYCQLILQCCLPAAAQPPPTPSPKKWKNESHSPPLTACMPRYHQRRLIVCSVWVLGPRLRPSLITLYSTLGEKLKRATRRLRKCLRCRCARESSG